MPETIREPGVRRFGRVNWLGLWTLVVREVQRFLAVWAQTLAAPLVTAGLFLAVFALALGDGRPEVLGVPFLHFLAPGVLMMTVVQNAFANTSSSVLISKVQGNIVDTLMPPLSPAELLAGYLAGGIARGLLVAAVIALPAALALGLGMARPLWALAFVLAGAALMAALGLLAGIHAVKFDQMAAITNFVVTPLAFLSGTFYPARDLPEALQWVLRANPVFYLIDGMRFGMLGVSETPPALGLAATLGATVAVSLLAWHWLRTGHRLKP